MAKDFKTKTKVCSKCYKEKPLKEFHKSKTCKQGVLNKCKQCEKIEAHKYYLEHRKELLIQVKKYGRINRKKINRYYTNYYKKYPWKLTLKIITQRCTNSNTDFYYCYGGKGIKCLITSNELKTLWFRDKAYKLKRPSIDRKDSNKNYTFNNCRYIELSENSRRTMKRKSHE